MPERKANTAISAFILAAGKGERMRPLTNNTAKPLLKAGQHRLIEYHLLSLAKNQIKQVVINTAYCSEQFPTALGFGERYGLNIIYSDESALPPLETAGGIIYALDKINSDQFIVVNGDVYTAYDFAQLKTINLVNTPAQAHIVLVPNPEHNSDGDFSLNSSGTVTPKQEDSPTYTYSGIGLFRKSLFTELMPAKGEPIGRLGLGSVLHQLIAQGSVTGEISQCEWSDIGTPERLAALNDKLNKNKD